MQAERVLHKLSERTYPDMHAKRRESLAASVMAALRGQSLTVTHLGRAMNSDAKEKHCIKRADRLLSNTHLHAERTSIYAQMALWLVGGQQRPIIVVDWSDMDDCKRDFLLRASIPVQGRSLTLYEQVYTVKEKEKRLTHRRFLETLKEILPIGCRPVIVSDAGFRTRWFEQVQSMGWDWVGRVRNRHWVEVDESGVWVPCKSLYAEATGTPTALGEAKLTWQHAMPCRLVLYKEKPKGRVHRNRLGQRSRSARSKKHSKAQSEPWLLATSLPCSSTLAKRVVQLYRLRMQIEEAFRDLKSTRFGLSLELHLTYQVQRLQILLLIAALALLVAWLLGKAVELTDQHRQYQANSTKDRTVLSTIFIGLCVIEDHRITLRLPNIVDAQHQLLAEVAQHGLSEA